MSCSRLGVQGSEVQGSRVQRFRVQPRRRPKRRPVKSKKRSAINIRRSMLGVQSKPGLVAITIIANLFRAPLNLQEAFLAKIGKSNGLTDIDGILVGHYTDVDAVSGITVVICPKGAVAGVDVRGSAPGTRETDLMAPHNLVKQVQAVVLSGGSVFGLAAADGATRWLAEEGYGFPLDHGYVAPIVPAAVLYDLGRGREFIPPISSDWGRWACEGAGSSPVKPGCVGAGTGALSGGIKGGLGTASLVLDSGITVAALVAVNSAGSVINPVSGRPWEIRLEIADEFGEQGKRAVRLPVEPKHEPIRNTTIGVVATDAVLSATQAQKVAQMAHDGMATGKKKLPETPGFFMAAQAQSLNELGHAVANCVSRSIIRAILSAHTLAGMTAFCDLEDK
jgi:L-aminopeptidase/D-esterase-like protein